MKILIINPFGVGDVLFTTPLISHLRKAYPQAFIGYIANRRALSIVESNSKVNKVYIYERDEFRNDLIPSWVNLFHVIQNERFDIVFDFSLNASFGFFSMMCGIKCRIGYDYRGRGRFLTDKILLEGFEGKHIVEYYLDLLDVIPAKAGIQNMDPLSKTPACRQAGSEVTEDNKVLEIYIDQAHQQWAKDWIKTKGIDLNHPIIALIPGGGGSWGKDAAQKRWPVSHYVSLVDKIVAKSRSTIILMGDQKEKLLSQELISQCSYPVYDAVGVTTLLQMAALLQVCSLAIVNDGGPLHVAVAVGIKTASIFGPVDPYVYGPFLPAGQAGPLSQHIVIQKNLSCQPCYRQFRKAACDHLSCLRDLSVDEVYNKIERLL